MINKEYKMSNKYSKINLLSPTKILKWTERSLPNGEKIGKITKSMWIKEKSEQVM